MTVTSMHRISLETRDLDQSEPVPVQQLDLLDGAPFGDLRGTLEAKVDSSPRREVAEVMQDVELVVAKSVRQRGPAIKYPQSKAPTCFESRSAGGAMGEVSW